MVPPMINHTAVRALRAKPLASIAFMIALVALTNAVLVGCGGNKAEQAGTETSTETATEGAPQTEQPSTGAAAGDMGAQVYAQRCALCHGAAGAGDGPAAAGLNPKPRNHTEGAYMNTLTDDAILTVIREGKGAMPAWKAVLTEEEIQAVLKHVRSLAVPPYQG
jgi:mono/diheme cytochrome c family protein